MQRRLADLLLDIDGADPEASLLNVVVGCQSGPAMRSGTLQELEKKPSAICRKSFNQLGFLQVE